MWQLYEERINANFFIKLEEECNKLFKEAYSKNSLPRGRVFHWYTPKRFSEGRESIEDAQRSGSFNFANNPKSIKFLLRMSIGIIAETVNAKKETVIQKLHDKHEKSLYKWPEF